MFWADLLKMPCCRLHSSSRTVSCPASYLVSSLVSCLVSSCLVSSQSASSASVANRFRTSVKTLFCNYPSSVLIYLFSLSYIYFHLYIFCGYFFLRSINPYCHFLLTADCSWDYFTCTSKQGKWPANRDCCMMRYKQCCMLVMYPPNTRAQWSRRY